MGNRTSVFPLNKCCNDILQSIFTFLSLIDQYRYRLVCKKWKHRLDIIIHDERYKNIAWLDKIWGKFKMCEPDGDTWPPWELEWIPNDIKKFSIKNLCYKRKSDRRKFSQHRELFTKRFISDRIELFTNITGVVLKPNMIREPRVLIEYIDIYYQDGDFGMKIFLRNFPDSTFYIRKKDGTWDGGSTHWDTDPRVLIDEYLRSDVYNQKFSTILIEDRNPETYTHIMEYIVYITQNYIDNIL